MSDLINGMMGKFVDLSQEEKQLVADMEAAHKEYNEYCADSEKDLNKKIDEIHQKMDKLNYYLDYAREHANASELEAAAEPFDTPEGTLESIRQTIKLDSRSDPNAESLYTKATGKKLYYEQKIANTRKLIDGSKVQAKRQYDSEVAKLNKRKVEHFEKVREYVQSRDFTEYLRYLVYDKSAFNSPGTVTLNNDEYISLGQRRVKLSVPMEIEQDLALNSNGEYNAAARTIGAPFQISVKKGGTLFLEHDERNEQYLLGGIQRLLLNFIKYFGENITSVLFCEPEHFDVESLGKISALGKGINPFITVPKSMEEIDGKVSKLAAKTESAPTPDKVSRILVLQNFPEKYSPDTMNKVLEMCRNAESTGLLVVLTHKIPMEITPVEKEIRELSQVIRSRNGGFWIEKLHESLFWYSAPSDISDEVRRVYVEKRRQDAVNAAQEPAPTPMENIIPAPVDETEQPVADDIPVHVDEPEQPVADDIPAPVDEPEQPVADDIPTPVDEPEQSVADDILAPVDEPEQPVADNIPAPVDEPEQPMADDIPAPVDEPEQPMTDDIPAPVDEPEQPVADDIPAPVDEPEHPVADDISVPVDEPELSAMSDIIASDEDLEQLDGSVVDNTEQFDEIDMSDSNDDEAEELVHIPDIDDTDMDMSDNDDNDVQIPAHILFANQQPAPEPKDVSMTVVSELSDQLEPSYDPFAPQPEREPVHEIEPDMTYRITDKLKAKAPEPAPVAPQPEREPVRELEPDMTYRITDKLKAKAAEPAPVAPQPEREPVRELEPDMTYRITDKLKPKVQESSPDASQSERVAAQKLDPDMTYRITDHRPAKAPEHVAIAEKSHNPIKEVFGAGKRKLEAFVDNRKTDNSSKKSDTVSEEPIAATDKITHVESSLDFKASTATAVSEQPTDPINERVSSVEDNRIDNHSSEKEIPVEQVSSNETVATAKGRRQLPEISIGITVDGNPVKLNIDGNITYICGKRGDDRKTLTERVIAHIMADTHPDDVELWMFDCGNGEFMKYAENPGPHIKYLVSDKGAETSLDFVDVIDTEMEHRIGMFDENGWSGVDDIPSDVYMPIIVVAVNSFPRFSENISEKSKYFGRNYNGKLTKLFKNCVNYGIHFLLIGSEFSVDGNRPSCLEGCVVHSAVVVSGKDLAAHKLFSGIKLYDNEIESLKKIPAGCAFTADENSTNGLTLVRIIGENVKNDSNYTEVTEYSEKTEEYLDKHSFIADRKTPKRFDDRREYREEQIENRADDECLLFLGEPCRFMGEYPVRLYDDFGENILAIAPAREKNNAALMVRAALRSLEEQGMKAEILACRSNPVYTELENCDELENITIYEGSKAESRIKELSDMIDKNERPNVFEIVLGGDLLVASMHADDMIGVLKNVLVKGPRLGTHFLFISGSAAQAATGFLSLFRHKIVFACPFSEAEKILREPNCDLPENGFRLSNDYDELTILPYSM